MALTSSLSRPSLAAATPVSWRRYREAAQGLLHRASAGPVAVPAGSPLRSRAVRFPDGSVVHLSPGLLLSGLSADPHAPSGEAARQGLARIAAAPADPRPLPPVSAADRRLASILRQPAFAAARPGIAWTVRRRLLDVLGALWSLATRIPWFARLSRRLPPGTARAVAAAAGLAAIVAAALAAARLARVGFEPGERRLRRVLRSAVRTAPLDALPEARRRLEAGDLRTAVRLIYAEALRCVEARRGVSVRPGWTAREIRRAAGLDEVWPGFSGLGAFHDQVLFGSPPGAPQPAARMLEAATWLEEVRRWARGAS